MFAQYKPCSTLSDIFMHITYRWKDKYQLLPLHNNVDEQEIGRLPMFRREGSQMAAGIVCISFIITEMKENQLLTTVMKYFPPDFFPRRSPADSDRVHFRGPPLGRINIGGCFRFHATFILLALAERKTRTLKSGTDWLTE